ncbi:CRISPR-associated endoribonuclease Cas6 [Phormidium sp. CCY1219]|uniref:CRISPR-associated endoribonuclease Cas6 n=1 Tax=Phormidium sp. CCY1219 TaxID=2886104 RepID=UPI002D1F99F1|nr:CRISPR-associated endoribonuclease Cas6 [Phormidium sp. CCY1219]MEB3828064.1 CRISPR-associated endoribonuclease Cas6 [Phormidium sp. CCY1219]
MPHSLVINLVPESAISPQFLQGRHLHALFLNLVNSVNPTLASNLHEQKTEKAFTISPLQVSKSSGSSGHLLQWNHQKAIPPGTSCWWRVSLLDDSLFGNLTQLWLTLNRDRLWKLGSAELQITKILGTPHSSQPWANFSSYPQLYENASSEQRKIEFAFCTPTAFRQGKYDSCLPTRESLFNSLLHRWNKYSNIALSESLLSGIFPSYVNIHSEIVADKRSKFIGCVGVMSYAILGQVPPEVIRDINVLADFALYCGAGRKTPMGMGMIRRLNSG